MLRRTSGQDGIRNHAPASAVHAASGPDDGRVVVDNAPHDRLVGSAPPIPVVRRGPVPVPWWHGRARAHGLAARLDRPGLRGRHGAHLRRHRLPVPNPDETEYYVAGRSVPALYNGMATAADWMSVASFIGTAGVLYPQGFRRAGLHPGWTGGCLVALLRRRTLQRAGQYRGRFPRSALRRCGTASSARWPPLQCVLRLRGGAAHGAGDRPAGLS